MHIAAIAVAALFLSAGVASAEFVAYTGQPNPQSQPPLQAWGGSLGMDFTVNTPITVSVMGVFNAAGDGVINGSDILQVGIFAYSSDTLSWSLVPGTYMTFSNASPGTQDLVNDGLYDLFKAIEPIVLYEGDYSVVAVGFSSANPNGNSGFTDPPPGIGAAETGSPYLTYTGFGRYDGTLGVLTFPTTVDGGPPNRYDAGTFEFSPTPEPATWVLVGSGFALVAFSRRRGKASVSRAA